VIRAAVLVKQVPDVRVGTVGTKPDGTIDRANAPAIVNPADLHAVEAALGLADEVVALSMGPSRAADCLREVIALGVDRGLLLSDRLFAGSDTWATANALAAALRHIGDVDLVVCGLSALDGETGQVGPQVAQRLGMPVATGCEALSLDGDRLIARRVVEGGYETVAMPLPAVVTISETGFAPRYPTLPGRIRGEKAEIDVLGASDLGLDERSVGLDASPTKVAHMELVPLPRTKCRFIGEGFDYEDVAAALADVEGDSTVVSTVEPGTGTPPAHPPGPGRGVWVVCDVSGGELAPVSKELLSKASELGAVLDSGVSAVILGTQTEAAAGQAARHGADLVLQAQDDRLEGSTGSAPVRVLTDLIRERNPDVVLFGATTTGRALAPRIAATLDTGLAADCTDLYVADWERRGEVFPDLLHQVRPAMAGGVLATCICPVARPQMATVRPGVFPARVVARELSTESLGLRITEADFDMDVRERSVTEVDVAMVDADVIVAGGAGCDAENWHLVEELAARIGGRVAASRAAVEAGLAVRSQQVGQTGSTVRPRLYIACGISGALQHVVGMKGSGTVLAINRDPEAAIFRFADYGAVGDVTDVLPKLTQALSGVLRR
jgi:electron transfer flavoprotein alpha subunit